MALLLWIYLAAQFLLFGAEFSKIYAETIGSRSKRNKPTYLAEGLEKISKEIAKRLQLKKEQR